VNELHRFRSMGCDVVLAGADPRRVQELFDRYDGVFSRFRPDSELNRVNACAGRVVRVSPLFARVLALALELARDTDGLLDPTVGGAVEAAGYDRDFALLGDDPAAPGPAAPGCWRAVRLHRDLLLVPAGVRLDLNGVVKALAVDDALALVGAAGFVSAGGDVAVRGALDVALPAGGAVRVVSGGLATSGSSGRRWRRGGVEQHHLIDPRTGRPSLSCWSEVTVSGATCLGADAAAKTAFLLGDEGPSWLDARRIPGRFVASCGDVVESSAWSRATAERVACT
jgi:FAD:protein FMN transferase